MEPVSTAAVADACLVEQVECAVAPLAPLTAGRVNGPAVAVVHRGSVDVFLEALYGAARGTVLVADDDGRDDEACIGDLVALEAANAGIAAIVIWGRHRDTAQLETLLPVWSRGACPNGPAGIRAVDRTTAFLAGVAVRDGDVVVADEDGVVIVPAAAAERVLALAREIEGTERGQAERARAGVSLREQFRFDEYLERRAAEPTLTFRQHLRAISAEVER